MTDEELYEQALGILSDFFNSGNVPASVDDENGHLLGVATIFMHWGKTIQRAAQQPHAGDGATDWKDELPNLSTFTSGERGSTNPPRA